MRIVIDTNVILDIFQKREPFFADSYQALRKSFQSSAKAKKRWNSFPSSLPLLMYRVWMFILLSCAPCQTLKMP